MSGSARPVGTFAKRAVGFWGSAVLLALMVGCASPGQPRPPSLHLPERVANLTAAREGGGVALRFTVPLRTTDKELVAGSVQASLCRAVGDGPCRPTQSFPGKIALAGEVEWVDVLPPELVAGPARRIAYRVEVFNAAARSAGPSEPVFAVAGEGPRNVEGFQVEGSHAGVVLRWTAETRGGGEVLVERESLNPPAAAKDLKAAKKTVVVPKGVGKRKGRRPSPAPTSAGTVTDESTIWLHASAAGDSGGMVDSTAHPDEAYRYRAMRSRSVTVDGLKLEVRGAASPAMTFTLRGVFPPQAPQALTAVGFPVEGKDGLSVDLVWQPNSESDLAGYNVYRQTLGTDGAAVKLNAKPVALPAFHDVLAVRGVGYRYTVTAVDSKGNESVASGPAELVATP